MGFTSRSHEEQATRLSAQCTDHRLHPLPWTLPVPLRVHGRHREGVLAHQPSATDLLFITLRKSRDLALGPSLFHWESQSSAGGLAAWLFLAISGVGGLRGAAASARVQLLQQDLAMGLESGQINLNGTPDKAITNVQIFMGQKIAKVDDLSALRY